MRYVSIGSEFVVLKMLLVLLVLKARTRLTSQIVMANIPTRMMKKMMMMT